MKRIRNVVHNEMPHSSDVYLGLPTGKSIFVNVVNDDQKEWLLANIQKQLLNPDPQYKDLFPVDRQAWLSDLQNQFLKEVDLGTSVKLLTMFIQTMSIFGSDEAIPALRILRRELVKRENKDAGLLVEYTIADLLSVTSFKNVREILENMRDLDNYAFIERRVDETIAFINKNRKRFKNLDFHNRQPIINGLHGFLYPQFPVSLKNKVGEFLATVVV